MPQYLTISLIIISLAIILFIVLRKFSILAMIDVENIEAEKQKLVKQKIINDKFKRNLNRLARRTLKIVGPILDLLGKMFTAIYNRLITAKANYANTNNSAKRPTGQILSKLFAEARYLSTKEDFTAAENKYIEIIGLDSANVQAFQELGEIYLNKENYQDAEQTFQYVIKLRTKNQDNHDNFDLAKAYFHLCSAYLGINENKRAKDSLLQALEIEPGNPKYLDKIIDLCIIVKDKVGAKKYLQKLQSVNPENNKLAEFKQRIDEL